MQQGWIKLHRKIQDHWIYQEKRKFSKYEAWLDLLMMASHKDTKFVHGSELIELKKGSFVTSELKLMERWDWGKSKLRSFLELLEKDEMIIKKSDRKKTTITICNYSVYHDYETENRPQTDHEQTTSRLSADTIKNVKNLKNVKENKRYMDLSIHGDLFLNIYLNYFHQRFNKQHKQVSEENFSLIVNQLEFFREQVDIEAFEEIVEYHFNNLPDSNDGSILAFIQAFPRYLNDYMN